MVALAHARACPSSRSRPRHGILGSLSFILTERSSRRDAVIASPVLGLSLPQWFDRPDSFLVLPGGVRPGDDESYTTFLE
jgi:hypothetical protein